MRIYAFYLLAVVALMATSAAHAEALVPENLHWTDLFWKAVEAKTGWRI